MDLRVDANEAWPAASLRKEIEPIAAFNISCVEQPVPHAEVGRLADVRQQFDMPIMLAVPDPDPMVDRSEYARLRDYVRQLTYVEFPGASHSMTAEIPDACARAYLDFLTKVEAQ